MLMVTGILKFIHDDERKSSFHREPSRRGPRDAPGYCSAHKAASGMSEEARPLPPAHHRVLDCLHEFHSLAVFHYLPSIIQPLQRTSRG